MTSKQRANLRAMASKLDPIYQIGKDNFSSNQFIGIKEALSKRELIKITVLKGSEFSASEAAERLSAELNAEVVATIGSKIILYKFSDREDAEHIKF